MEMFAAQTMDHQKSPQGMIRTRTVIPKPNRVAMPMTDREPVIDKEILRRARLTQATSRIGMVTTPSVDVPEDKRLLPGEDWTALLPTLVCLYKPVVEYL